MKLRGDTGLFKSRILQDVVASSGRNLCFVSRYRKFFSGDLTVPDVVSASVSYQFAFTVLKLFY